MSIRRITFTALVLCICLSTFGFAVTQTRESQSSATLFLQSGYSADGYLGGLEARSLQLSLERSDQGWVGWMSLDPNEQKYSEFGTLMETTLMAGERIDITLTPAGHDEASGRTCYLVEQTRFDQRIYLVFPHRANGTYRLVVRGSNPTGTHVVFLAKEESLDGLLTRR